MFGCFLLLAELAVFVLFYWYFRVRKISTYQIEGDPWGSYSSKRKCDSKFANMQEKYKARTLRSLPGKNKRSPILFHQTHKHGWVFSEKEQTRLMEITGVNLEITTAH